MFGYRQLFGYGRKLSGKEPYIEHKKLSPSVSLTFDLINVENSYSGVFGLMAPNLSLDIAFSELSFIVVEESGTLALQAGLTISLIPV